MKFSARLAIILSAAMLGMFAGTEPKRALAEHPQAPSATPTPPPGLADDAAKGNAIYAERCSTCHDHPQGRIPPRTFIGMIRSPDSIIQTLSKGVMKQQATGLSLDQMRQVAIYLTGRAPGADPQPDPAANMCKSPAPPLAVGADDWNGWGRDPANTRYQPKPGLTAEDLPRLKVKWAFAFPDIAYGQPVVVGGRIFITTRAGQVFSLDAATGCTRWYYEAGAPVRTAVTIGAGPNGALAAYFADEKGNAHAIEAETGKALWTRELDDHPLVRVTGAPKLHDGILYVPTSSMEEVAGATPTYPCCTFRGAVVALDAATGKVLWKSYMIQQPPAPTKVNPSGTQMYGPAGGAVWDSPTIDSRRGVLYVGTGDSYTDVRSDGNDAVVALDLKTGKRTWVMQAFPADAWLVGCPGETKGNCPTKPGPDVDFGASPVLQTMADGKDIIVAAAKSGIVYGLDPDDHGKMKWQIKLGEGNSMGSILWGPATDREAAYVAVADVIAKPPYVPGGVTAVALADGKKLWHRPAPPPACAWGGKGCSPAQPGAVIAIPGLAFASSWDGHLRAYSVKDGSIVWDFDTGRTFDAVNGVKAKGGAMDMGSHVIADGMLVVTSGTTPVQHPGNALLVLTVDGK